MCDSESLMTSFLFGNLDDAGNLENSVFDEETKTHLSSLGSLLNSEETLDEYGEEKRATGPQDFEISFDQDDSDVISSCSGTLSKASSAEDFGDINELIEDEEKFGGEAVNSGGESSDQEEDLPDILEAHGSSDSDEESTEEIERPLANMLPDLYRGFNVKCFFPAFRRNKVLRFSRLFGLGKTSSLPRIWRGLKSRRRDKMAAADAEAAKDEHSRPKSAVAEREFECETDDELLLLKPQSISQRINKKLADKDENKVAPWRYGPAAYWYDQLGLPTNGQSFDYNMKLNISGEATASIGSDTPAELFLPLNLERWEDKVIFDAEEVRQEMLQKLTSGKQPLCGWIPTQQTRTYESFMATLRSGGFARIFGGKSAASTAPKLFPATNADSSDPEKSNFCIFPPDNLDLIYGDWEKDVIIDPQNMRRIAEPLIATVDLCDDPLLYGIPEDMPGDDIGNASTHLNASDEMAKFQADRKEHVFTKKSQLILGRVAQRHKEEEEEAANVHLAEKDDFNISNDDYYTPRGAASVGGFGGSMIQHSIPAQNLAQPFFPTYWSVFKLRHFHRAPLKRFGAGRSSLARGVFRSVQSLESLILDKANQREQERVASGGGEMFFMRKPEDLSGKDGDVILCEYSEQHPPLIMQPGMNTKIKNFYKRRPGKESAEPKFDFGETSYTHTTPFLGTLAPGDTLQALENNLFRAPIYKHHLPSTDFLIIREKTGYSIRRLNTIYAVGQQCPLYEVPNPNSKRASNFVRDYLMVFIYRLFWQSADNPRRLKMDDVRRAFPHYAESTLRKRLKQCAEFKRLGSGPESTYWVLKGDFRLPGPDEIRAMVSPEMCCAFFCMQAAEQLLKDAGYGERYFVAAEDDEDDGDQGKMADEIRCAPWNTTRSYISAMKGKCMLDLTGVADPTGCGEGFSYVRVTAKPPKDELPQQAKRTVTGTDADLRKLSLKDAKLLLKEFGVKDDEIKTLTRWEIIDVIRTLSTQQARSGGTGITKFARGSVKYNVAEVHERYKQECQRIFDLQNKVLSSTEYLSTDDEASDGAADSDLEEMGKNIESMLSGKKSSHRSRLSADDERAEREELRKFLRGETSTQSASHKKVGDGDPPTATQPSSRALIDDQDSIDDLGGFLENDGRKLKIYRKRRDDKGREFVSIEVVSKPQLIAAYLKIRQTKDEAFIKHFAQMDEQYKEEKRREKRRLQDQLRRIKRNEVKAQMGLPLGRAPRPQKPAKPVPPPKASLLKMRCSACGATGHMKTNKHCPLYGASGVGGRPLEGSPRASSSVESPDHQKAPKRSVAPTDEQLEREINEELSALQTAGNLTSIEGTKIKLSRAVLERAEKMKKKALKLKFPKHVVAQSGSVSSLKSIGPGRGRKKKLFPLGASSFAGLVAPKLARIEIPPEPTVDRPKKIEQKILSPKEKKAQLPITLKTFSATKRKSSFGVDLTSFDPRVKEAATVVGPSKPAVQRRRADPRVTMSVILEQILNELRQHECSRNFVTGVNKKLVIDYYKIVKRPMDLQTIKMNLSRNQYLTREEFLKDIRQILDNSRLYNGDQHELTHMARTLLELALKLIAEREQKLMKVEKLINPLLDDNDLVAFCFILDRILQECKRVPKSFIFHHPVDKRKYPTYYDRIDRPMDLGTMETKCKRHQYETVDAFVRDVGLIYKNCETFNGPTSSFTTKAREILDAANKLIAQNAQHLADLEKRVRASKQKVLDDMETASQMTGVSSVAGDRDAAPTDEAPESPTPAPSITSQQDQTSVLRHDLSMSDGEDAGDGAAATSFADRSPPNELGGEEAESYSSPTYDLEPGGSRPVSRLSGTESGSGLNESELSRLLDQSSMAKSGRLHTDLAMSDSDDNEDERDQSATLSLRPTGDDFDFSSL